MISIYSVSFTGISTSKNMSHIQREIVHKYIQYPMNIFCVPVAYIFTNHIIWIYPQVVFLFVPYKGAKRCFIKRPWITPTR